MKEVSCKIAMLVFDEFRRQHLPLLPLTEGVGYSLEHLQDRQERIEWSAYCRLIENAQRHWSAEDFERCGATLATSPLERSTFIVARLLFGPSDVYGFIAAEGKGPGHQLFTCIKSSLERIGPRRLRLDLRLLPGYEMCEPFFWCTRGSMTNVPTLLGLGPATVAMGLHPDGATYTIDYPEGGGLLRPVWKALTWPFTARTAARELRDAHDALLRRYQELDETRARLEATQAQLVQAGKLAALGQLGAGIAHELNQPILSIRGFAQRVLRRGDTRVAENVDELERIIVGADRMARIVEGIRLFSCDAAPTLEPLEAFAPINAALDLLGRQLRSRGISVTGPSSSDALPPIRGDRVQLEQVFLNLLINARDALTGSPANGGRRIRINARRDGDHAVFVVEDNGPGIPDDIAKRIFDPFFTTKGPDRGTGLGLSISYGIVREHNGEILHERPASGGARFIVRLPLFGAPRRAAPTS